jgi:hypothetical protein
MQDGNGRRMYIRASEEEEGGGGTERAGHTREPRKPCKRHAIESHVWQGFNPSNRRELCHYTDDVTRMQGFNPSNKRESQSHSSSTLTISYATAPMTSHNIVNLNRTPRDCKIQIVKTPSTVRKTQHHPSLRLHPPRIQTAFVHCRCKEGSAPSIKIIIQIDDESQARPPITERLQCRVTSSV